MKRYGRAARSAYGAFIVDGRGTILGFDESMELLTGWPAYEVVGRHKNLPAPLGGPPRSRSMISVPLFRGPVPTCGESRNIELTLHCRDGKMLEVEAEARPLSGLGDRMQVTLLRVMASSPARRRMRHARDRRDELTGLQAPEAFGARLESEFHAAARTAQPLGLVVADVDHLREINDRLGYEAGDEVLRKLAGILRVCVDDDGRLCRVGEDDFAILLPRAGRGDARQLAASLRSTVERYRFFPPDAGRDVRITLSLGAASFPADAESAPDLLERAREALDEARSMGRNRVWCYLRKPRVPVEVPVYFDAAESSLVGYARDLSPSGIFVQTSVPIDIGMRCALTFPLPGASAKVHVIGRVVRTVPPEVSEDTDDVRVPGMGVEFEQFGGSGDRHSIDAFLHDHESETLRPEKGLLSVPES